MNYADLTDEQKAKVKGKTPEQILELAKQEGYELTDDELSAVAGGQDPTWMVEAEESCPLCGAVALKYAGTNQDTGNNYYRCERCGRICK
ncbi:MAG: hypothetical protein IJ781_03840 [Atopobiaceae bacterium]|nr:hypothetical protein [Atopobiaceae bacterium]